MNNMMHHPDDNDEGYDLRHQEQTANIMDQFGMDLAESGGISQQQRREQRIKRGECPTCRRKTHKVSRFPTARREPLNIPGQVTNGHCLRCRALRCKPDSPRAETRPAIPEELVVPSHRSGGGFEYDDDAVTVASEITMDPLLTAEASSSRRYSSRPPLMASHFESVTEEEEETPVAGAENERMEREQEYTLSRSWHMQQKERLGWNKRMPESKDEWENYAHLLQHTEETVPEPIPQQSFHPLSTDDPSDSSSEKSLLLNDIRDSPVDSVYGPRETSNGSFGLAPKQKFHPLSKVANLEQSERSMDNVSQGSKSAQTTDSDRILRLCQGSRSSLTMEVGRSPQPMPPPQARRKSQTSPPPRRRSDRSDSNRFSLKRLSSSNIDSADSDDEKDPTSLRPRRWSDRSDSNRFSLKRLSSSNIDSASTDDEKDEKIPHADTTRKKGGRRDSNRFSLTRLDSEGRPQPPLRSSMPPHLLLELNRSKNLDSKDILRDAAAEADGGDLDAAVDALFGVDSNTGPAIGKPNDDSGEKSDTSTEEREEEEDQIIYNQSSSMSRGSSAHEDAAMASTLKQRRQSASENRGAMQLSTIDDIPSIIKAVQSSSPADSAKCTERSFQSLFLLATDPEPEGSLARKEILANNGMETLVSAIWDHMQSSQVLLALIHALWAISVFNGKDEKSNAASADRIEQCRVLEGLLFAMQTHSRDLSVQEAGCDLITRLSGLLPEDTPEFKSAVVLLAGNIQSIGADTKAYSSCLDALNSLCQLNGANKLQFAKAGEDAHRAIIRGLRSSRSPGVETKELACQLFWCTTSERSAVSALSSSDLLAKSIIDAMKSAPRANPSVHFYGAACGTLANLAQEPNNHRNMVDLGVVPTLCDAIYEYSSSADVHSAVCTALANLSASRNIREDIVSQGAIPSLFVAMKSNEDNVDIQSEAFRALHNLCESSTDGKRAVVADLDTITTAFFRHEGVKYIQQVTCSMFFRLSTDSTCRKPMIAFPYVCVVLAKIMKSNPRKKAVQKAACSALRNLSLEEPIVPTLRSLRCDSLVIEAMNSYPDSEDLQESACTFLLNLACSCPEASVEICSVGGIEGIVKVMRAIPSSASLQRASCGALSALTKADAHKQTALSVGAVDAVICLMVIHLGDTRVLENAANVLAHLSSMKTCTCTIADNGGIATVVEATKAHPSSTKLIQSGSRFFRNMALADPDYANEAAGGIAPILSCLDEHPGNARLVEEACKALRCLVLKSENCKDCVLSADGVAVIEKTMKANGSSQRWQSLLLDELFQ